MKKTTITLLLTFIMTLFVANGPTTAGTTKRVSVDSSGAEGNDQSWFATKVSANGKIAFGSYSTNLVNGDNNNEADVFVHDLNTGETIRVSVDSMGAEANGWSDQHINLSTNGNTVSFASEASNLVANDTNGFMDIFLHDLETGTTDRVSLANDGSEGNLGVSYFNALSADGSVVAFMSLSSNLVAGDTNGLDDIFVRDRNSSSTERVSVTFDGSEANDYSGYPAISGDGNIVLFTSPATNLIPGGTTGIYHTYTYDRTTGAIEIVDVATDGTEANSFSDDASVGGSNNEIIAFRSGATNLVPDDTNGFNDVFVRDMSTGVTKRVSVASDGSEANGKSDCWNGSVSDDGRFVVFVSHASNLVPNDTNGKSDIFVHELSTGITERVSIASDGTEANGWTSWLAFISADGRYVSFESNATNLVAGDTNGVDDIFVHDRTAGTTKRVSVDSSGAEGNDQSWFATKVSANGKIAFGSYSTNLVNGDNNNEADVFVHDLNTGETIRVSVDSMGAEANGWSDQHINLSTNGNTVSFASEASNLVANDTNGFMDIFLHDLETGTTDRVSLANDGSEGNLGVSYFNALSADGSVVAFMSLSSNLVAGDTNGLDDIFVRDRNSSSTERVSVTFDGSEANDYSGYPAISGDGNIVLFTSPATNLIPGGTTGIYHTYTYDRTTGAIEIVDVATDGTEANGFSDDSSVGGSNNEIIAFRSGATNLVPDDTNGFNDVFVRDMSTGVTKRVSVASDGSEANGKSDCWNGSVSDDGRFVVFVSRASNLVPNDTNGKSDIFVHELSTGITERVSIASEGTEANGWTSWLAFISADGRYVSFESNATNLVAGDTNGVDDIFVHDRYDDDGDGYASVVYGYDDCDDTPGTGAAINPGAMEICKDNIDNNCDGLIDDSTCVKNFEICNDNLDNDGDGKVDCADNYCKKDPLCP